MQYQSNNSTDIFTIFIHHNSWGNKFLVELLQDYYKQGVLSQLQYNNLGCTCQLKKKAKITQWQAFRHPSYTMPQHFGHPLALLANQTLILYYTCQQQGYITTKSFQSDLATDISYNHTMARWVRNMTGA